MRKKAFTALRFNRLGAMLGGSFSPALLFAGGEPGVWSDPSDLTTLFQDVAGTTPVTSAGQTVALMLDKSGRGNHATQPTAAARPSYIVDADGTFIQHDLVDDALTVTLPDMGTEATVAYVTRSGVHFLEDQTISGSYTLPTQEIAGFVAIDRALTFIEKVNLIRYLASKVEGVSYGAEIDRLTLIAINAVDVFVYDTSKDSDGGAWRTGALAQATSWYNETLNTATRGARREFPAVAVIVAETNKVTIYDGDDPTLPMWAVWTPASAPTNGLDWWRAGGRNATSISAINGIVYFGINSGTGNDGANGLGGIDFVGDKVFRYNYSAATGGFGLNASSGTKSVDLPSRFAVALVSGLVNDVAMTLLPDAPIDPATGLPVPTIAVATAGGVSVIKDNGTVVDITYSAKNIINSIAFDADNNLTFVNGLGKTSYQYAARKYAIPMTDIVEGDGASSSANDLRLYFPKVGIAGGDTLYYLGNVTAVSRVIDDIAIGNTSSTDGGLTHLAENVSAPSKGMVAYTTSTYNTGWMNGDIKGAFLSDTDDTDLVGAGELVTNGAFDTDTDWTKGTGWTISGGVAAHSQAAGGGALSQTLSLVVGKTYVISATIDTTGDLTISNSSLGIRNAAGTSNLVTTTLSPNTSKVYTATFVATETNSQIWIYSVDDVVSVDNVSVRLADKDRSVNGNGLQVFGTVTRTPVATGADLVAYSGFSSSNYLEQPYNSGLDFGTGDFCVMGWVKLNSASAEEIIHRQDAGSGYGGPNFGIRTEATGNLKMIGLNGTNNLVFGIPAFGSWAFVTYVRQVGVAKTFLNAVLSNSAADNGDYTNTDATLLVGALKYNGSIAGWFDNGSLALWRISATAPTAEQIAKIYNDEKFLFQDNAQATLYGASDAVTALAHDPDTDLLHVGTSAGRSIFEGLRRVGNTTTSVSKAISASGGLIVEK